MNKRSITTKTGDKGRTRLFSGEDVPKNSPRLEAYGDLDELVSMLSIARHLSRRREVKLAILDLQRALFVVGSELATTDGKLAKLPKRVDERMLADLEEKRVKLEAKVPFPSGFVIPGNTLASAYLDYGRTIARRCERKTSALLESSDINNSVLIIWLNRLSDYLYLLARFEEKRPLMVKEQK